MLSALPGFINHAFRAMRRAQKPWARRTGTASWPSAVRGPIEKHFRKHNNDKYFIVMCFAMFTCLPRLGLRMRGAFERLPGPCLALQPAADWANRPRRRRHRRFYNCLNSMYSHYFSRVWRMLLPVLRLSQCMKLNLQSRRRVVAAGVSCVAFHAVARAYGLHLIGFRGYLGFGAETYLCQDAALPCPRLLDSVLAFSLHLLYFCAAFPFQFRCFPFLAGCYSFWAFSFGSPCSPLFCDNLQLAFLLSHT